MLDKGIERYLEKCLYIGLDEFRDNLFEYLSNRIRDDLLE